MCIIFDEQHNRFNFIIFSAVGYGAGAGASNIAHRFFHVEDSWRWALRVSTCMIWKYSGHQSIYMYCTIVYILSFVPFTPHKYTLNDKIIVLLKVIMISVLQGEIAPLHHNYIYHPSLPLLYVCITVKSKKNCKSITCAAKKF